MICSMFFCLHLVEIWTSFIDCIRKKMDLAATLISQSEPRFMYSLSELFKLPFINHTATHSGDSDWVRSISACMDIFITVAMDTGDTAYLGMHGHLFTTQGTFIFYSLFFVRLYVCRCFKGGGFDLRFVVSSLWFCIYFLYLHIKSVICNTFCNWTVITP